MLMSMIGANRSLLRAECEALVHHKSSRNLCATARLPFQGNSCFLSGGRLLAPAAREAAAFQQKDARQTHLRYACDNASLP
jgi:hypothetical protein